MIKHILKLMWNKKTNHIFFFVEILIIFLILTMTTLFTTDMLKKYFVDLGYETEYQYIVQSNFGSLKDSMAVINSKILIDRDIKQNKNILASTWLTSAYPLSGNTWGTSVNQVDVNFHSLFSICDLGVEKALDINIIKGRSFDKDDYTGKYIPILVNKMFYDEFVKVKGEMIDSIIEMSYYGELKIIGVMEHYKQNGQFTEEKPYFMALNHPDFIKDYKWIPDNLIVKTTPNPDPIFQSEINDIFSILKGDIYISNFEESRISSNSGYWAQLVLVGIISLFLLINISLGLIGILSFNINQRKGEIGLRKVMGASTTNIVTQFVGEVMFVTGIAIFIGILLVLQLPYLLEFDLSTSDLYRSAFLSMVFIFILLFLSSIIPSLKGARLEPSEALHEEG